MRARAGAGGNDDKPRPRRPGRIRRIGLPYLLLLPALGFELLIHLVPMVVGVLISFKALTQLYLAQWQHAPWAGLGNYRIVADVSGSIGQALLHSFTVTCAFTALAVSLSWLFGCAAAILAQDAFRGRGVLRAIFLTPYALPVYASVITWAFMFQYNNGLVNHVLHDELGITSRPTFWLLGDNSFGALVMVSVWRNWPFAFLVIMAGLQSIPREFYEAAAIDGAGPLAQFWRITVPLMTPTIFFLLIMGIIDSFQTFTTVYVLTNGTGGPEQSVLFYMLYLYQKAFVDFQMGYASAMAWVGAAIAVVLALLVFKSSPLWVYYESERK